MGRIAKELAAIRCALQRLGAEGIEQQTLSVEEAAERLGETKVGIRRLVEAGLLRWVLVGRKRRIPAYLVDRLRPI